LATVKQRGALLTFQAAAVALALLLPDVAVLLYLIIAMLFIAGPLLIARKAA
jgi:hypothetical protein